MGPNIAWQVPHIYKQQDEDILRPTLELFKYNLFILFFPFSFKLSSIVYEIHLYLVHNSLSDIGEPHTPPPTHTHPFQSRNVVSVVSLHKDAKDYNTLVRYTFTFPEVLKLVPLVLS